MNSKDRFNPQGYDLFFGMDVDKHSIAVTILDGEVSIIRKTIPYEPEILIKFAKNNYPGRKAAFVYEAGPTGYGLYDKLSAAGYTCLVTSPSKVPIIPGNMIKTNRLDSMKLAQALKSGQIHGIRVPSPAYRHLRHLTRLRDNFSRQSARCKCQIKSLLLFENLPISTALSAGRWSLAEIELLKMSGKYDCVRFKLDRLLEALEFNDKQIVSSQKEIRRFCQSDSDLSQSLTYLMSVPGVGWIVGAELLARIGDWRLLNNAREIGSFLGLTPREKSTGDDVRRGRITKTGHQRARKKLVEGSWMAVRRDDELKAFYWRIYHRHPRYEASQKAIIAVARKLTGRIYRVLKDRRCYEIRNEPDKKMIVMKMVD